MTLVIWVDDLEDLENLARYFRTRKPRINRLRAIFMNAILNEQYARWRSWVDAYYGSSWQDHISLYFYFASPAYAPLTLYGWLSSMLLEYRVKGEKDYQKGVDLSLGKPLRYALRYGLLTLYDLASPHTLFKELDYVLDVEYEPWLYSLHIEEKEHVSLGSMVPPRLLPQLLL